MPNEIAYGFTPNFILNYIMDPNINFLAVRVDATNALDYAAMNMKFYYDHHHIAMFFTPSN